MKITFNSRDPEQLTLIKAMGSANRVEAANAQAAFAALMGPILNTFYQQADTTKFLYEDITYRLGDDPSIPAEFYSQVTNGRFGVWSQTMPGGLATNTEQQSIDEIKFTTYTLDSAISMLKKYASKIRLDILAKAMERMLQEVLLKTNTVAWNVIFAALAGAVHPVTVNGQATTKHYFASTTAGQFTLDDYNKFLTFFHRLNSAWTGGTPVGGGGWPTDLIISPEMMQKFRAMGYNAINTTGPNGLALSTSNAGSPGTVALPESQRAALYTSGGVPEFYGIALQTLDELGPTQAYQLLYSAYVGNATHPYIGASGSSVTFNAATNDLVLAIDAKRQGFYRALATDGEDYNLDSSVSNGSAWRMEPDDQFFSRQQKFGFYGGITEGRLCLETRQIAALVI